MKYPIEQYKNLVAILKDMQPHFDLKSINPSALHFEVFQQVSEGHSHNWFYFEGDKVFRAHKIADLGEWEKVVKFKGDFDLYPNDCIDSNIETAVRKALKEIGV